MRRDGGIDDGEAFVREGDDDASSVLGIVGPLDEAGLLVSPAFAESLAAVLNRCEVVQLGGGARHLQEDHRDTIGRSTAALFRRNNPIWARPDDGHS